MSTAQALIAQQRGANVAGAWPQVTPNGIASQNLDLLQIVTSSGSILVNVDYLGAVHKPASNPTTAAGGIGQVRVGQYLTRLTSAATLAAIFADVFSNPSNLDILQVIVPSDGSIQYSLNYQGVASGS
jgi:hypothetical protein